MSSAELIQRAFELLGDLTPLEGDCGALCGAVCCRGDDGMLLFPGEHELLAGREGFSLHRQRYGAHRVWWLGCPGSCERSYRPLACRIFPLAPVLGGGTPTALIDPRAAGFCPLEDLAALDPAFVEAVGGVFAMLAAHPQMMEHMRFLNEEFF